MAGELVIAGLDIGTTKVCACLAQRRGGGNLEITGVGVAPSNGMKKGVVVNIESTLRSIAQAVEAAEMMSGSEVSTLWTGIGGDQIKGINSRGVVSVAGRNKDLHEISTEDVDRVLESARAIVLPLDQKILEVIPQAYIVDHQAGIRNPIDMIGVRLEAEVHIITCPLTSAQNLVKCVNRAGYKVPGLILQSLASGRAVLTEEEKELGVAVIDLGGGTTDLIVYVEGSPYFTSTVPLGGAQVSGDISIVMSLPLETAEKVKREQACCWASLVDPAESVLVPGMGGRAPSPIPKVQIQRVVQPRMAEIFSQVKEELDRHDMTRHLSGGVVLTGGGANILGAAELAVSVFHLPVRIGLPLLPGGLEKEYRRPEFATAVGLALEGDLRLGGGEARENEPPERWQPGVFAKMVNWVKKEFF
ncbi:MAG: cell division protein FtsA [Spirochaetaceae bacterium]|nr:cell division protein FtsA [Spirochaetaceae bacterium]